MVVKFVIALLGFLLGFTTFFSFVVAPVLFSVLDKKVAGNVVSHIFPTYFGSETLLYGLTTILLVKIKFRKLALISLVVTLLAALQAFGVLPLSEHLKETDYELFKMVHGISMGVNLVNILATVYLLWFLIFKADCEGKKIK